MNQFSASKIIQVLANIGVIGGIIFLAVEVRQNQYSIDESNRIAEAEMLRASLEAFNEWRMMKASDSEVALIWLKGQAAEPLDEIETERFRDLCKTLLWDLLAFYMQALEFHDADSATGWATLTGGVVSGSGPGLSRCWEDEVKPEAIILGYEALVTSIESTFD